MRARALAYSLVGCAAALGITWEIGLSTPTAPPAAAPPASTAAAPAGGPTAPSSSSSAPSSKSPSRPSGTFTGATAETAYGPMQVAIVVKAGRITDVKALQVTNQGDRSVAISAAAVPVLRSEALRAQSARIAAVSGASYTSQGYTTSLQSALDKAHL
jgi:uncharacterized protein with FMN-binding domain